jgi:hypothetical protein
VFPRLAQWLLPIIPDILEALMKKIVIKKTVMKKFEAKLGKKLVRCSLNKTSTFNSSYSGFIGRKIMDQGQTWVKYETLSEK